MDAIDLSTALQRFPFTPDGQVQLMELLMEQRCLDDRRFRWIHPRNTSLLTHLAYVRRQAARRKPFRSNGSSELIHRALLRLLVNPESPAMPPRPSPRRQATSAWVDRALPQATGGGG